MQVFYATFLFLFTAQMVYSQYQIGLIPRVSPDRAVYQKIGHTELEINYGSPAIKGRPIWGKVVSYGEVWRAGANNATTVEVSDDILIDGVQLDSGKYALFMIPRENDKWTVIFNKTHKQWGAFNYDESEDALRLGVIPRRTAYQTEDLTYSIKQMGYQYGSIVLNWQFTEIEVPFETNYLAKFKKEVATRASLQPDYIKWIVYLQGAEHLENIGSNIDLGLEWINTAEQIMNATSKWNDQFYPRDYVKGHLFWTKAKLLAKTGDLAKAGEYVQKTLDLENPLYYQRKNEEEGIDRLMKEWTRE